MLLGRGRDYAWSATSAGQDIIDTFAVPLCEPDGRRPTIDSMHYIYHGQCVPIEVLEKTNSWTPNAADQTPPGSETLHAERTQLGLVEARATVAASPWCTRSCARPTATRWTPRSGSSTLNDPGKIRGPEDFKRAASKIGYTFNWFYVDHTHIAYFNSGNNPVRAKRTSTHFPVSSALEWKNWNADVATARYTPPRRSTRRWSTRPTSRTGTTSRRTATARGRRQLRLQVDLPLAVARGPDQGAASRGGAKMSITELIDAMEDAGTVDLRAAKVLPYALQVLGRPRDPQMRQAVALLRAWVRAGAHRRDRDRNGTYEHAEAVSILDRWWPKWMRAQFRPALGRRPYKRCTAWSASTTTRTTTASTTARPTRRLVRLRAEGPAPPARPARARAATRACTAAGRRSARATGASASRGCARRSSGLLKQDRGVFYKDEICDDYEMPSSQWCFDAVRQRPVGAINQPLIHWINRPTFQQVVEIQKQAPR